MNRNSITRGSWQAQFDLLMSALLLLMLATVTASATVTYQYTGNHFNTFSCGPFIDSTTGTVTGTAGCSTPAPTNTYTSYTASDLVNASLTFDSALDPNMALQSVTTRAGFLMTLNDGHQTVSTPITPGQGLIAMVATDANGQITQWRLILNTGGTLNGGVSTQKFTSGSSTIADDMGTLSCCDPQVSGNFAFVSGAPGVWNGAGGTPTPSDMVNSLLTVVFNPNTGLTGGQQNSLADKLNNVLLSLQAGEIKQAINQLNAFISSVQSWQKTGKVSTATATALIDAANAIIAALSS